MSFLLEQDPELMAAFSDPEIMAALQEGTYVGLILPHANVFIFIIL